MREFELSIGDVLEIDGRTVTVIDIDGNDVRLRVDERSEDGVLFDCAAATTYRPGK